MRQAYISKVQMMCSRIKPGLRKSTETFVYNRKKDSGTATGDWFRELLRQDAWFKDVVPNVSRSR